MALGGGCELLLHSNFVQAHVESYIGLTEALSVFVLLGVVVKNYYQGLIIIKICQMDQCQLL